MYIIYVYIYTHTCLYISAMYVCLYQYIVLYTEMSQYFLSSTASFLRADLQPRRIWTRHHYLRIQYPIIPNMFIVFLCSFTHHSHHYEYSLQALIRFSITIHAVPLLENQVTHGTCADAARRLGFKKGDNPMGDRSVIIWLPKMANVYIKPWETMGKPWENRGKMVVEWDFMEFTLW